MDAERVLKFLINRL